MSINEEQASFRPVASACKIETGEHCVQINQKEIYDASLMEALLTPKVSPSNILLPQSTSQPPSTDLSLLPSNIDDISNNNHCNINNNNVDIDHSAINHVVPEATFLAPTIADLPTAPTITDSLCLPEIRKPDRDAFKLFVGQVPKNWDENKCRELLEPYGDIYQLNILKDKSSLLSRGMYFFYILFIFKKLSISLLKSDRSDRKQN